MKNLKLNIKITLILILSFGTLLSMSSNPKYYTITSKYHYVKKGDTLSKISNKYNISISNLRLFNNLNSDTIIVGQKIYLTPHLRVKNQYVTQREIPLAGYHIVKKGDTLSRISKMYDIPIIDIINYNDIKSFEINKGEKLYLTMNKPESTNKKESLKNNQKEESSKKDIKKINPVSHITKASDTSLFCPVKGKITSRFGMRNGKPHKGVDIAASVGTPIYAVQKGKVVYVGRQRGYGNVVILEHDDYVMTVYAHNESNLVRLGDNVEKGQPIAKLGQSGTASGPHLHFEYRVQGKAIDPCQVLSCLK